MILQDGMIKIYLLYFRSLFFREREKKEGREEEGRKKKATKHLTVFKGLLGVGRGLGIQLYSSFGTHCKDSQISEALHILVLESRLRISAIAS